MGDQAGKLRVTSSALWSPAVSSRRVSYLTDPPALLTKHFLSVGRTDDDVGDGGRDADLDARVTLLSQLALEELVQLGVEDTVGDELSALGDVDAAHGLSGGFLLLHVGRRREGIKEDLQCKQSVPV